MIVAFFSDVHANLPALQSALEVAERFGAERLVLAGDAVGDGPQPAEVIELLRERRVEAIRGNVDRKVLRAAARGAKRKKTKESKGSKQRQNRVWTAAQLSAEQMDWLKSLPKQGKIGVGGPEVLVVHGSPRGDADAVLPSLTGPGLAGKLEPLNGARPAVLVCGHTHVPFAREIEGTLVINCGSVGRPADGDPRGSFALVDFQPQGRIHCRIIRFAYPVERVVEELRARNVPGPTPKEYERGVKS